LPLFPTLLYDMSLGRFKKIRTDWYGIKHISLWPLLILLLYWMKHKDPEEEHRMGIRC